MSQNRDNCIILLVDPPETDTVAPELKAAFGPERAALVNSDLLAASYKLAKTFSDAILILSYQKSAHHPDLTWLDPEDPGFLEVKDQSYETRVQEAFRLAFFTGAKKAVLISHLAPELKADWLSRAFEATGEKTVSIGACQDGSFYLLGLAQQHLKVLEPSGFSTGKSAETLAERVKKNKFSVFATPETYAITGEDMLLKWMEAKEDLSPGFPRPAQDEHPEHPESPERQGMKKLHRRHARHQEAQVQPPPEKPPL